MVPTYLLKAEKQMVVESFWCAKEVVETSLRSTVGLRAHPNAPPQ
jgi:hypothetical protein